MAMEWHTLPANYLDFQRELEETRNGFQMVKNFITDLVQVEDQYTSRLTYLTEKHTKCIFNSNIMATASNSVLTSQAYKNLEETIVMNKQYLKTVEEQIRPKIQDLEDHLVSETAVLNEYIQTSDKSLKSYKKDREAADAKYTSAKRKAERKESQKSTSVKSRLKSSFSTKDQDSKHKEKIAIMKMHQEEMLKANDEYNLQLKKQFDTVLPEIIKKQEALYRTSLELFYGTFQEFEAAQKTRDDAITNRQCKIAVTFASKTEVVQKSSENVFISVQKSKRSQPTPFPTTMPETSKNHNESNTSISSENDAKPDEKLEEKSEDKSENKTEDFNEEVFDDSKSSSDSPKTGRSTFEELHSQAAEDIAHDSFSEASEEESGEESGFDLDEVEREETVKSMKPFTTEENDKNDFKDEENMISVLENTVIEDADQNSSNQSDDKSAASQVEALLKALKDGTDKMKTEEKEEFGEPSQELISHRFRVKFNFDSSDYGEEFLTITEGEEVEAELSADWKDEDGWIAVKRGDKMGAVPYDYLEILDN